MPWEVVLIGYSGHAFVVVDAIRAGEGEVVGYCDRSEKEDNPYGIEYLGQEERRPAAARLGKHPFFVSVGDNQLREALTTKLLQRQYELAAAVTHPSAVVSPTATVAPGALVAPLAVLNARSEIGRGAIVNTAAVVEHECSLGAFAHLAPGAVLLGNVSVGPRSLIGGKAIVLPGVRIGADCLVGAGSVVLSDLRAGSRVAGNPARPL